MTSNSKQQKSNIKKHALMLALAAVLVYGTYIAYLFVATHGN